MVVIRMMLQWSASSLPRRRRTSMVVALPPVLSGVYRQSPCEMPTFSAHSDVVFTTSTSLASLVRSSITNKSVHEKACRP